MPEITDGALLAALGRQLNQAVARQTVAASNLANIDTPGYRAQEVSFDDALDDELGGFATHERRAPAESERRQGPLPSPKDSHRGATATTSSSIASSSR